MPTNRAVRTLRSLALFASLLAAPGCDTQVANDQITVNVALGGFGTGRVTGSAPATINCPAICDVTFLDAGAGGLFTLEAVAGTNSTFGAWAGCNSASGTTCTLSFSSSVDDTTFNVSARFDTPFPPVEGFTTVYLGFPGTGAGRVTGSDPVLGVDIDCTDDCRATFEDLGTGGNFDLEAVPAAGSVFAAWTGCTTVSGAICSLSYSPNAIDTTFVVTARFDLGSSPTNTINIYNGSGLTADFVVNSQPLLNVPNGQSPSFQISTAIGTTVDVSADVGGEHPTITCTVTAAAWQGPGNPIVILNGPAPYHFACTGF